jgi:5-methylcytosine-specific restriction endonuclease McrA
MIRLNTQTTKVQGTKVQDGLDIEKVAYIKRRRGRIPRLVQQDRKKKDNDASIVFVNHVCKLCGHVCNFIRSCTTSL